MRTNIEIDDTLMEQALAAAGTKTKRETVVIALTELIGNRERRRILDLQGVGWDGDLDAMRTDIDA